MRIECSCGSRTIEVACDAYNETTTSLEAWCPCGAHALWTRHIPVREVLMALGRHAYGGRMIIQNTLRAKSRKTEGLRVTR